MILIAKIVDFFQTRSQKKHHRAAEIALSQFRTSIRVPYAVDFKEDSYNVHVWVEHDHLQDMIDACKPQTFLLEVKQVRDDCSQWSLTFRFGKSIWVDCSWLVAYACSEGIPTGYRRVDGSTTWVREGF